MKKLLLFPALLILLQLAADNLYTPVLELASPAVERMPHGLWLSGINGAAYKRQKSGDGFLIVLDGKQGVANFNAHTPVDLAKLPPGSAVSISVRCLTGGTPVRIMFDWGFPDKQRSKVVTADFRSSKQFRELILPLPQTVEPKAAGFRLTFDPKNVYEIGRIAIVRRSDLSVDPFAEDELLHKEELTVTGKAAPGIRSLEARLDGRILGKSATEKGGFRIVIPKSALPSGKACSIRLAAEGGGNPVLELPPVFVYPTLRNRPLPQVTRRNGKLHADGRPFAFTGTNYTDFMLGMTVRKNLGYRSIAEAVTQMQAWGMRAARVTLNIGAIQPAEGVFPGDPRWEEVYRRHKLRTDFFEKLEYFVALAGDHGIYTVFDFHGIPADPYRYFLGGQPADRAAGKPGSAIAYLAKEKPTTFVDVQEPRELKALEETFVFLARHFRGNPNVLGFEVPFNEPHDSYMSIPANFNRVTGRIIRLINAEDPERLTFSMPPAWGHDNASPAATWLPPDGLTGGGPHFYVGNGPVPLRPDAKQHKEPWLCRDADQTFDYALAAVLFPYSGLDYPVYNGEGGEHGNRSFLPAMSSEESASLMIDATLTQCYAAGLAGFLQWTMWSEKTFRNFASCYAKHYPRFGEVYAAGPVDWSGAEVAVIQNPAAVPIDNGYNFACVPFARLMLDLHLGGGIRYLTDDQIIHTGLTNVSVGLEQVSSASMNGNYKALVVDRRNLDARVERALRKIKTPILWVDDAAKLKPEELAAFLEKSGIRLDRKTPAGIQVIEGPAHLVLYRRSGDESQVKVHPLLKRKGRFTLTGENGETVFSGDAEKLHAEGFAVSLPKWHSMIFRIGAAD